jgi:predicted AlkP superfamily pyrophosphatase or phosphodiesterase
MQTLKESDNPVNPDLAGVILMVLDGCRPDGLQWANAPNIDSIMKSGSYTLKAQTVIPPITFPCHMSMLFGVKPLRHGIYGNYSIHVKRGCHHSILDVAHMCGRKGAAFYDWEQLRELASPTALEFSYYRRCSPDPEASMIIARACANTIMRDGPDLCFMNLGSIDMVGHAKGWMSKEYIEQIETIDRAVGIIIEGVRQAGQMDRYYFIVLSDHGGTGNDHGTETAEELTIPWMVSGPGIRRGYEIRGNVQIYDTAPTVARLLKLPVQGIWQGKVITEIFEGDTASRCHFP